MRKDRDRTYELMAILNSKTVCGVRYHFSRADNLTLMPTLCACWILLIIHPDYEAHCVYLAPVSAKMKLNKCGRRNSGHC